jgi:hypothetical protein
MAALAITPGFMTQAAGASQTVMVALSTMKSTNPKH